MRISLKQKNSALTKKIVQNPLFRSCAARFRQIWFLSAKVLKIVKLTSISRQKCKTVRFPWKLYKTLFSGHAQHVLAKSHFWASKFSKSWNWPEIFLQSGKTVGFARKLYKTRFSGHAQHVLPKSDFWARKFWKSWNWPQILFKAEKQCAFHENCITRSFQAMRSRFWPNRILERQSCQNRHAGLKFSRKRENSAPSMKIVLDALFRSCAALFCEIAFLSVKVFKIVKLAWNYLQKRKTVRFRRKLYKTRFSGRFRQIWFLSAKVLKIVKLASHSRQNWKTVRFPWKLYKTLFSGHAQRVLAKSHFWASKFSKSWNWPQILFHAEKLCAFQVMRFSWKQKNGAQFRASKFLKSSHWPEILFKSGKQCVFLWNCPKRSFQVMRSTFLPNRIFERQSFQNRETGLKFSSMRKNCALFRSCAFLENRKTVRSLERQSS